MRTMTLRSFAHRAVATLGAVLILTAVPAFAGDAPATGTDPGAATAPAAPSAEKAATAPPMADRIFEGRAYAGYRATDTEDERSLLFPYDPLTDGPILGLDLLYLTPQIGALKLDAGFLDADSWQAEIGFSHGSDVGLNVRHQSFSHAREHAPPLPHVAVDSPPPAGMDVDGVDEAPDKEYRDERQETAASLKVRIPNYPAHISASGRIDNHRGDQQLRFFTRGCASHICHTGSSTRELDQQTQEFTAGLDAHAGPIDFAYSHIWRTFRDEAQDPTIRNLGMSGTGYPPPGDYAHDVNPDQRSGVDSLILNTNLTNRIVLSLSATNGEQENETSGLSTLTRTAGAELSWRVTRFAFLTARYNYEAETTGDLGDQARELREARNTAHAAGTYAQLHQHVLEPEQTRHTAELSGRVSPDAALDLNARLRYRALERFVTLDREKKTADFDDESTTTTSWLASLGARYRPLPGLALDVSLGQEWAEDPFYAVEYTKATRYGLGATWTPSALVLLRASYQGFSGENDDTLALQRAYAARPANPEDPKREVRGDAVMVLATFAPATAFSLTASWNYTDNGVEQDMVFGSPANPTHSYLSPDTSWSGRAQTASLRARWETSKRLAFTADGTWLDSLESYAPNFAKDGGLEELGTVDFTTLHCSVQAEARLTARLGLTVAAFWARYDDRADDAGDGTAQGLLGAVDYRW